MNDKFILKLFDCDCGKGRLQIEASTGGKSMHHDFWLWKMKAVCPVCKKEFVISLKRRKHA